MNEHDVSEQAYKNGYSAGYVAGRRSVGADAVKVDTIRSWLYGMAMNNTDNYLCNACEEIISRLDGLLSFAKMDLPQITEQTKDALMKMGENAHGETKD